MNLKKIIMKRLYPNSYSSEALIKHIRKMGGKVGNNTYIYNPQHSHIDLQNARFISIGDNCLITAGVTILAHDYSWSVVANKYNEMLRPQRRTRIGNNVFIGINSVILMGASIGNNTIIGAGSVVSGSLEGDCVYAGVPAKKICSIDEYYNKLRNGFLKSAKEYARVCSCENEMGVYLSLIDQGKFKSHLSKKSYNGINVDRIHVPRTISTIKWEDLKKESAI